MGHGVDAIDVADAELRDEGGGEHAVEFDGVQGAGILSGALEGVRGWVEVARLPHGIAASWRRGAAERFDLLGCISIDSDESGLRVLTMLL